MTRCVWFVLVMVSFLPASARGLDALLGQDLQETSHEVVVTLNPGGTATYEVTRTFHNFGAKDDELYTEVLLPPDATASAFDFTVSGQRYRGKFEPTARAYDHYMGSGASIRGLGARPRALLSWQDGRRLRLRAAPVPVGQDITVTYRLRAPLAYEHGRYVLQYPGSLGRGLLPPRVRVRPRSGARVWTASGQQVLGAKASPTPIAKGCGFGCAQHTLRASKVGEHVRVFAEIEHARPMDLSVRLVSPQGDEHVLRPAGVSSPGGSFRVEMEVSPRPSERGEGAWRLQVQDEVAGQRGEWRRWGMVGVATSPALQTTLPDMKEPMYSGGSWFVEMPLPERVRGRVATLPWVKGGDMVHAEFDVTGVLSRAPQGAQVVLLVDISRSNRTLESQREVLLAYLSHLSEASVQVVTFARHARALFSGFLAPEEAAARLRAHSFVKRNGSNLDDGLRVASALLKRRAGPRRLVVVTDANMRASLGWEQAARAWRAPGTIAHVVEVATEKAKMRYRCRGDETWSSRLAGALGGGLHVEYDLSKGWEDKPMARSWLRQHVEHLVRPIFVEDVKLKGWPWDDHPPERMREGERWSSLEYREDGFVRRLRYSGRVWREPVTAGASPTRIGRRALIMLVIARNWLRELPQARARVLAKRARVISDHISSFAGVTGPPDRYGRGMSASTSHGYNLGLRGRRSRLPHVRLLGAVVPSAVPLLTPLVSACRDRHGPWAPGRRLMVERDHHEILDVRINTKKMTPGDRCVVEAVWALTLPEKEFWGHKKTEEIEL